MDDATELAIPERHAATACGFDTRPRAVDDWLQNLPVANLGETSRAVYEVVRRVNRTELAAGERIAFLEQLRPMIGFVSGGLRKHYIGRALPLRDKPQTVASLATISLQEMALGYEIALQTGRRNGLGKRALTTALVQSLHYRGRVMLENWLVYQTAPEGTWQRLHALYAIALELGVASRAAKCLDSAGRSTRRSPQTAYKHVLLTATAGPMRLQTGAAAMVWQLLEHWCSVARIVNHADDGGQEAAFRVPRRTDAGPHANIARLNLPDDRLLVTTPLVAVVEKAVARIRRRRLPWQRQRLPDVNPELRSRVMLALAAVPARQQARIRATARVAVVVGLTDAHRVLSAELGVPPFEPGAEGPRFQGRDGRGSSEDDVWDLIYPSELMRELQDRRRRQPRASAGDEHALGDWNLVNISAGGYCLLSDRNHTQQAEVGDLILLREIADRTPPWQLGCIRWLRGMGDEGLQVGLELLGPAPIPVLMRAERGDGHFGPLERGFLLPAVEAAEQPATLIAPGPHYGADKRARLRQLRRESVVVLDRQRDATAHFLQFDFHHSDALAGDGTLASP